MTTAAVNKTVVHFASTNLGRALVLQEFGSARCIIDAAFPQLRTTRFGHRQLIDGALVDFLRCASSFPSCVLNVWPPPTVLQGKWVKTPFEILELFLEYRETFFRIHHIPPITVSPFPSQPLSLEIRRGSDDSTNLSNRCS